MVTALIIGAVLVAAVLVAWATWRRPADERHSVQEHQHTLETLRHMSDRTEEAPPRTGPVAGGRLRRNGRPVVAGGRGPAAGDRPGGTGGSGHGGNGVGEQVPLTRRREVTASRRYPAGALPGEDTIIGRSPRRPAAAKAEAARRPATMVVEKPAPGRAAPGPASSSARPVVTGRGDLFGWRGWDRTTRLVVAGGAAVVLVAVALTLALVPSSSHRSPPAATGSSHPARGRQHGATTSTVPPSPTVVPSAATTDTATYTVPASLYAVTLHTSAPCWVDATEAATGKVLWTGTMTDGQTEDLSVTGTMALRLGAAGGVSVTMDGKPVQFPPGLRAPFTMTFQPA